MCEDFGRRPASLALGVKRLTGNRQTNTAIYYPHLYPPLKWLRVASLCWDTVYNIEPPDARPRPQALVEFDSVLGGFLEPLAFDLVLGDKALMDEFSDWVEARAEGFRQQPLVEERQALSRDLAYLYPGKLGGLNSPIVDRMQDLGLARVEWTEVSSETQDWQLDVYHPREIPLLFVPPELADHYLAQCASYLAEQRRSDLATTDGQFTDVVVSGSRAAVAAEVAHTVIDAYLPSDIEHVEPVRLAELRDSLRDERHEFQADVEAIVNGFEQIASEGQMEHLKRDAVDLASAQVDATRRTYQRADLKLVVETLGISVAPPALLATTASLLGVGLFAPIGIAAALSFGTVKAYLAWRERGEQRRKAEWSYVFEIERGLRSS